MPSRTKSQSFLNAASLSNQLKQRNRARREGLAQISAAAKGAAYATYAADAVDAVGPAAVRSRRNDLLPQLALCNLRVDELRGAERKLRKADAAHVREVANAITALGFCDPILIGADNLVLDGEIRLAAARMLGLDTVPCVRVDHLSKTEQRLLRLAANRLGEKGAWRIDELKLEFEELVVTDTPIEISGFAIEEIDQVIFDSEGVESEMGPLASADGQTTVARFGDVFRLGRHRIACGDAVSAKTWLQLLNGDAPARLLLTDEPFNVPINGHVSRSGQREFKMATGEMSNAQFAAFNEAWIACSLAWLADGAVFGSFIDWRGFPALHAAAVNAGLIPLNLVVWGKTIAGMGSLYRSQHELLPLFKYGSEPHVNNINLGKRGRWRSNLWSYPGASTPGSDARRGLQDHPTVKPVAMLEDALIDLSHRDDLVLDPFLGSGSTLIACERTGRVCRGLELDPLYVDVIVRRFEAATGVQAVLDETGETFAECAKRRRAEQQANDPSPT